MKFVKKFNEKIIKMLWKIMRNNLWSENWGWKEACETLLYTIGIFIVSLFYPARRCLTLMTTKVGAEVTCHNAHIKNDNLHWVPYESHVLFNHIQWTIFKRINIIWAHLVNKKINIRNCQLISNWVFSKRALR